jgi:hypothetical protein
MFMRRSSVCGYLDISSARKRVMQPAKPFVASTVVLALMTGLISRVLSAEARAAPPLGVNYATGNGMDQLNCDGGNTAQIAADMRLCCCH